MKKFKKIVAVLVVMLVVFAAVQNVVAQTTGIDLVALVQQKAASIVGINTANANAQLEQTRQQTMNDTVNYVDNYVKDLQQSLDQYTAQQTEAAKQKIKAEGQKVKETLEVQKQGTIENSKAQIKAKIDEQTASQINQLNGDLNAKITEKFKN